MSSFHFKRNRPQHDPAAQIIDAAASVPAAARRRAEELAVDEGSAGQRLDNFLFRFVKGVPKTHVYRLIRKGEVRVNKGRAAADRRLEAGDVVRVPPLRRAASAPAAATAPARVFPVLFEDERLIAIDKPSGVAVHGGSGVRFGVVEQLRAAYPQERNLELVHRLDRGTSGVLLLAKRRSALRALQAQFRAREVHKTYLALVLGEWPDADRVIDVPLQRYRLDSGERRVREVAPSAEGARRAVTLVTVRQHWPGYTLLEVTIKTGRTHQIRVHLSARGFPIVGDDKYGDFSANHALRRDAVKRLFLHAWALEFTHPKSGERVRLTAPLPPDLPLPPDFGDVPL